MKYIVAIVIGGVVIGATLTAAIYFLLGYAPAYFFVKFIAGPLGLAASAFCFLVYDTLWPRRDSEAPKTRGRDDAHGA